MNQILRYKNVIAAVIIGFAFFMLFRSMIESYTNEKIRIKKEHKKLEEGQSLLGEWHRVTTKEVALKKKFLQDDILNFNVNHLPSSLLVKISVTGIEPLDNLFGLLIFKRLSLLIYCL